MSARLPPRVVALTLGDLDGRSAVEETLARLRAACDGGLRALLVREPALGDRALAALVEDARTLLGAEAWLAVHDRAHLAAALGCDAVHLGFRSLGPPLARRVCGADVAIGFSAHAGDAASAREGADYLFLGPVHDTPSKRGRLAPLGLDGLARECAAEPRPAWAIGGITPADVAGALGAGARGVAVRAGILGAADPARAAASYEAAARAVGAGERA